MLVDSHCHLDFPDFAQELDAVVGRGRAAGIGRFVTISTKVRKHGDLIAIASLTDQGVEGAIVGKALYAERFTLPDALAAVGNL